MIQHKISLLELTAWIAAIMGVIVIALWLSGCTAVGAEREQALKTAMEGTYTRGKECAELRVATGRAAVAAAQAEQARAVHVTGRQ